MKKKKQIKVAECGERSTCPLTNTLDIIGDKWTLVVIRDMLFVGKRQFNDFLESPEGISTNILTERLRKLEQYGIITKHPYQKNPVRHEYQLTERGQDLMPVLLAIAQWGQAHIDGIAIPTEEQLREMREHYSRGRG